MLCVLHMNNIDFKKAGSLHNFTSFFLNLKFFSSSFVLYFFLCRFFCFLLFIMLSFYFKRKCYYVTTHIVQNIFPQYALFIQNTRIVSMNAIKSLNMRICHGLNQIGVKTMILFWNEANKNKINKL